MNCEETQCLLYAYLDAELDAAHNLAIEQHLQNCAACTRDYENAQALRAVLHENSLYFQAPASLRKRVQLALPKIERAPHATRWTSWSWLSAAALLLLILGGLGFWIFFQLRPSSAYENGVAQAVVNSHERSLVDDHLVDILSSDPTILKAWFEGKLGYAPPVINLTLQGFSLVGGRLDFLDNQPVAAIIYKCGQHVINLFVWPTTQTTDIGILSMQGYYLTHWTHHGMNCWAVTDLGKDELQQFAHLINQHLATLV